MLTKRGWYDLGQCIGYDAKFLKWAARTGFDREEHQRSSSSSSGSGIAAAAAAAAAAV